MIDSARVTSELFSFLKALLTISNCHHRNSRSRHSFLVEFPLSVLSFSCTQSRCHKKLKRQSVTERRRSEGREEGGRMEGSKSTDIFDLH